MIKRRLEFFLVKVSQGIILSLAILGVLFAYNKKELLGQLCLYEVMPNYKIDAVMKNLFTFERTVSGQEDMLITEESEEENTVQTFSSMKIEDVTPDNPENDSIIGLNDIIFQPETETINTGIGKHFNDEIVTINDLEQLRDLNYLKNKMYIVDKNTGITGDLFNVDNFLNEELKIDISGEEPKVLIFHTHSNEKFADSIDKSEGILEVGNRLANMLESKYAIKTLHDISEFDIVDGKPQVMGAYERMEPHIKKVLADNPSIKVVIDLHRDGVREDVRLVKDVNGKPTAQIMFFNGLTKLNRDGVLTDLKNLPNEYLNTNLAFSFNMQMAANEFYPGLARKIYLNAYRYSLHMMPRSLVIEVGAQTNTKEEVYNVVEPLADMLANVLLDLKKDLGSGGLRPG